MTIDLASPPRIPPSILAELRPFDARLRRARFLDDFVSEPAIARVVRELDRLCFAQGIVGYHYTRAIPEQIAKEGLVISSGEERRRRFIAEHGHRFTRPQLRAIEGEWTDYFDNQQNSARNGRLWFAVTLDPLTNGGADRLLSYFGGEAVYMPLTHMEPIAAILNTIGEPLVVSCRLDVSRACTFTDVPWGKAWLSAYHLTLNPEAHPVDWDVYVTDSVPAERIVTVRRATGAGWVPKGLLP